MAVPQRAGVDIERLIMCQPDSGEMALEVVDNLVRSGAVDIIVIDSVAALVPRAEIEGEIGAVQGRSSAHTLDRFINGLPIKERVPFTLLADMPSFHEFPTEWCGIVIFAKRLRYGTACSWRSGSTHEPRSA